MHFNFCALSSQLQLFGLKSTKPKTLFQRQTQVFSVHGNYVFHLVFDIHKLSLAIYS